MRNLFFVFCCVLFISCGGKKKEPVEEVNFAELKDPLIKHNQVSHEEEMERINAYIKRHGWKPVTTGTGINYVIYQKADTSLPKAKTGQVVTVNYKIKLLDDSEIYSSAGEPASFLIGMDDVESGLHEAITFMREGEKALIILPSARAFGLSGDNDMIPPNASLIYDIELIKIADR